MEYEQMTPEMFDAVVTGELTHFALWYESCVEDVLTFAFCQDSVAEQFRRLVLRRDGLTAQDKIEIARSIVREADIDAAERSTCLAVLKEIEEYKVARNAMAHGVSVGDRDVLTLQIETVSRSGKASTTTVTPASHRLQLEKCEALLARAHYMRDTVGIALPKISS